MKVQKLSFSIKLSFLPFDILQLSTVMDQNEKISSLLNVSYDREGDILAFSFTKQPKPALAEETADDVWVRYDQKTKKVITVDVLNFSHRVQAAFGSSLTYSERMDSDMITALMP
jgi:uncharacterized protein YuzE